MQAKASFSSLKYLGPGMGESLKLLSVLLLPNELQYSYCCDLCCH